ncbi:MAG: AAA family ATPase [Bacteroidetes bacterium]|nr:AAA family ATPase [Bacteroidota bacterium]
MKINRNAYKKLLEWKDSKHRKPLLLRGARQVGKTTLVRQFAKEFVNYIELTLEKEADRQLFEKTDEIRELLSSIYLLKQVLPGNSPTLLFIDEIQESPKAIQLLRYFYEEKPDLFVIAAGSLLEFALKQVPSFPVGRIEYLTLHPINFDEFLGVLNPGAREVLYRIPIPEYAHHILLKLFHEYAITGGMPEVISNYAEDKNIATLTVIYKGLWQSYKDDAKKYARNNTERKVIRHVIETAPGLKLKTRLLH